MIFNKKLDLIEWSQYLEDLTLSRGDINYNEKSYPFVEEVYQAGTLEVSEGDIPVFYLKLTQTKMNTRVKISQFIQHIIPNNFDYTSALAFIEYSDESYQGQYRFSYVKIDRDYNQTTGKYETIRSNPRRYTFVLGEGLPTHTPNQQLKANAFRSIPSIEEAFSVEPVNKEFYKAIQEHFDNIIASVSSTLNSQDAKQFALRFLGRILFCWFLREKELIPRNLLKSSEVKNKYYRSTLESLFFDVLNQAYGTRTKLLDHEKEIPFLNGGLFTPQDDDHKGKILIDDEIIKNLFETFELYNFTVDESTPSNIEMSIDPEMLGRVFENLLAEIDENTGDSARKSTGSFYTPREIVDYMVVESLKQYFKNNLKLDDELLDFMFNSIEEVSSNPELSKKTEEILNAIHKIKILDPACGSGAFPMGILQRIFILIERIDPEHKYYKKTLLNSIPDDYARRKFEEYAKNEQFDYAYKMKILKDCIYGVDIQESATEISRLRAFLSLIVEEKIDDTQDNRGIEALPNLQFQFITANSLKPVRDTNETIGVDIFDQLVLIVEEISKHYFSAHDKATKLQYKQRFEGWRKLVEQSDLFKDVKERLLSWSPFENKSAGFFEPHIQFGIDKDRNFDIVIGNPPYGAKLSKQDKELFKKIYKTTNTIKESNIVIQTGMMNTYNLFIEKAHNLLEKNGVCCYIVPISVISAQSASGIHRLLEKNCKTIKISSYAVNPQPIFQNAVVNVSIISFSKTMTPNEQVLCTQMYRKSNNTPVQKIVEDLEFIDIKGLGLEGRYPKISKAIEKSILTTLKKYPHTLANVEKTGGSPVYYRGAGGRYFKIITPYTTNSSAEKSITVEKTLQYMLGATLSTSLFFWWYQIYSDNLNLTKDILYPFPILHKDKLDNKILKQIESLYSTYLKDIEKNCSIRQTEKYAHINEFKEYKISSSKHLIDQIDDLICPLYGLTTEETEFIKNYEIKFRISD